MLLRLFHTAAHCLLLVLRISRIAALRRHEVKIGLGLSSLVRVGSWTARLLIVSRQRVSVGALGRFRQAVGRLRPGQSARVDRQRSARRRLSVARAVRGGSQFVHFERLVRIIGRRIVTPVDRHLILQPNNESQC